MPECQSCAAILSDADTVCGHCGARVDETPSAPRGVRLVARTDAGTVPPSIGPCGDRPQWFFEWQDGSGYVWRRFYATHADAAEALSAYLLLHP